MFKRQNENEMKVGETATSSAPRHAVLTTVPQRLFLLSWEVWPQEQGIGLWFLPVSGVVAVYGPAYDVRMARARTFAGSFTQEDLT